MACVPMWRLSSAGSSSTWNRGAGLRLAPRRWVRNLDSSCKKLPSCLQSFSPIHSQAPMKKAASQLRHVFLIKFQERSWKEEIVESCHLKNCNLASLNQLWMLTQCHSNEGCKGFLKRKFLNLKKDCLSSTSFTFKGLKSNLVSGLDILSAWNCREFK